MRTPRSIAVRCLWCKKLIRAGRISFFNNYIHYRQAAHDCSVAVGDKGRYWVGGTLLKLIEQGTFIAEDI